MRSLRTIVSTSALLACASFAHAATVVVPNAQAAAAGNAQGPAPINYYGSTGSRNQVLYPSSDFSGFGAGQPISTIQFRPFPGSAPSGFFSNTVNISNVLITLSSTQKTESGANALSANYADNVGANVQTVYSGPLTLTTNATDTTGGVKVFDYTIQLQTPFVYAPSLGNLLLDVTIPNGATVSGTGFGFLTFDNVNTNGDGVASVVNLASGSATSGTVGTDGAIAQFSFNVPEPGSASLAVMLAGMALSKRRRR